MARTARGQRIDAHVAGLARPCGYRTRGDIPWDVKVKHHLYFVPLAVGLLLAWAAVKSNNTR
jgi:hypothetical protein